MSTRPFRHESDSVVVEADRTYVLATQLARTGSRLLDESLRRHSLRALEHAIAAGGAPSPALRAQSLRFATMKALQLCGTVEAAAHDGHLTHDEHELIRDRLSRLLSELDEGLRRGT